MGLGSHLTNTALLEMHQKVNIQILVIVASAISIVACTITMYWFVMMRWNFRRVLIMLLIFADLVKSLSFLVYSAVSLAHGTIKSSSPYCQAGGFFIQTGLEACDISILFMSLHMSLQIIPCKRGSRHNDGLYRYRYAVFALYLIVPSFDASLAFVNKSGAYLSQGAFCTLPIRPFWYRLALSWIPRYLVWIYVMSVVVRIYRQVGSGFKVFARNQDYSSSNKEGQNSNPTSALSGQHPQGTHSQSRNSRKPSLVISIKPWTDRHPEERSSLSATAGPLLLTPGGRRPSVVHWESDLDSPTKDAPSTPGSSKHSAGYFAVDGPQDSITAVDGTLRSGSTQTEEDLVAYLKAPEPAVRRPSLTPIPEAKPTSNRSDTSHHMPAMIDQAGDKRRRMILRQVRLLFIYPVVYMILMIFPFVSHCMNYSDFYAAHPIYVLSALNPFCLTFLGFVDCLVFCWREKPWSTIPGSDGTFLGSFYFWRFRIDDDSFGGGLRIQLTRSSQDTKLESHVSPTTSNKLRSSFRSAGTRPSHKRVFSGNSDRAALEAERAQERLTMERAAYAEEHRLRPPMPERVRSQQKRETREWFDIGVSDGADDDDDEEEETGSVLDHREKSQKDLVGVV